MAPTLQRLRAHAILQSLFPPTTLKAAVHRLAFVQADPIQSPARAQDFILRHRVKAYRAGDLERQYCSLNIEEDYLYAYGFLSQKVWQLLHPRTSARLPELGKKVLDTVRQLGEVHPKELDNHFGRERVINAWGGYSRATKCILEDLHHRGLLRIARRENGIRIYEMRSSSTDTLSPTERMRKLIMVIAAILAPVPERRLLETVSRLRRSTPGYGDCRAVLGDLLRAGELEKQTIDGLTYVWPPSRIVQDDAPQTVRFLAPFDPLVWDRRRFEHFWEWPYCFEAYTPSAKRLRGYYAMPLLWGDRIIGWANASVVNGQLNVALGFVKNRPREDRFRSELEDEIGRMQAFLNMKSPTGTVRISR